jgi:hypothetical protein
MNMNMKSIVIPYASTSQISSLIRALQARGKLDRRSLETIIGGKSTLANILPTAKCLKLVGVDKEYVELTPVGAELARAVTTNNVGKVEEAYKSAIKDNAVFDFTISLLDMRRAIKNLELGEALATKFGKTWSNPLSYSRYGACTAEILAAAGYGSYSNGMLYFERSTKPNVKEAAIPAVTIKLLRKKILPILFGNDKSLQEVVGELKTSETKISDMLTNATDLGLVHKTTHGRYALTNKGKDIVSPKLSDENKKKLIRDLLLNSPYGYTISSLKEKDFDRDLLGKYLAHDLARSWKSSTSKWAGGRLLNWLKEAGLVEKKGRTYRLRSDLIDAVPKEPVV